MLEWMIMGVAEAALDARDINTGSGRAHRAALESADGVARLEQRLAAMELAMETVCRVLVKSNRITEEEFFRLAREIDAEDGILDGRRDLNKLRKVCPQCSRPNAADRGVCMWCGSNLAAVPAVKA